MQKRIKKIAINILAVAVLLLLILVIFVFNSNNPDSFQEESKLDNATSSFSGPVDNPTGIKGPSYPPPFVE